MVGLRFGENPRQVATLADLRVRGKGKKRRAAVGCSGLVTRQRSIIRRQRWICHGRGTCMCHRTKFARGDGVQPTRCSCRSMPRPMRARNTRRCPHDAHKDLAALEIVCTPRCCDCLLKGEAQSHPQSYAGGSAGFGPSAGPPDLRLTVPGAGGYQPASHYSSSDLSAASSAGRGNSWDFGTYISASPATGLPGSAQATHYQFGIGAGQPQQQRISTISAHSAQSVNEGRFLPLYDQDEASQQTSSA
jgi:hypothetical protein